MKVKFITVLLSFMIKGLLFSQSWTNLQSGTTELLRGMHFPTENVGYVVGNNGRILKTSNQGISWTSLTESYPNYIFWDVHFFDENNGFVVGETDAYFQDGLPSGHAVILKTTNGGLNWTIVYTNPTHPIRDLFALNENILFASGGAESIFGAQSKLIKSTDGGLTWNQVGPSYDGDGNAGCQFGEMYFLNENKGFLYRYDYINLAHWCETNDGGSSFSTTVIPNTTAQWILSSDFPTANTGYFSRCQHSGVAPTYVKKTTDAGISWNELTIPNFDVNDLDFIDANVGLMVCSYGNIIKTIDGGNTFTNEISNTETHLKTINFINPNLAFAAGEGGVIIKYSNNSPINFAVTLGSNSPVCIGETLQLTANVSPNNNDYTYTWTGPNGFSSTLQNPSISNITAQGSGIYNLTVSLNGSTVTETISITVSDCSFEVNIVPNATICEGEEYQFPLTINPNNSNYIYAWSGPNGYLSTMKNPVITNASTTMSGIYTVTVTASESGTSITKEINLQVINCDNPELNCLEIYVPSAFSPDSKGPEENNTIKLYGGNCISQLNFSIYNRWGEKVFESTEFNSKWDGTFKGLLLISGTYTYKITYLDQNNNKIEKSGYISLIR